MNSNGLAEPENGGFFRSSQLNSLKLEAIVPSYTLNHKANFTRKQISYKIVTFLCYCAVLIPSESS